MLLPILICIQTISYGKLATTCSDSRKWAQLACDANETKPWLSQPGFVSTAMQAKENRKD